MWEPSEKREKKIDDHFTRFYESIQPLPRDILPKETVSWFH